MYKVSTNRGNHIIIYGSKGCGKSKRAQESMGLTPLQYQEECEKFNDVVATQLKQRREQNKLFESIMMSYYEELNEY
jgi:energy-coupling factor transporter ATP-binding protein EcfA2